MFLKNNSYLYSPSFEYNEYDVIKQNNFRYYKIKEKLVHLHTVALEMDVTST